MLLCTHIAVRAHPLIGGLPVDPGGLRVLAGRTRVATMLLSQVTVMLP